MKAAYIESFGSPIIVGDRPKPELEPGDVRIAVRYAGVNPVDWKIAEGHLRDMMPHEFPLTLGWEASGVIDEVAGGPYNVGDEVYVYCRKPVAKDGSWAEYLTFPADQLALKPKSLSLAQAAAVPLAGLTAWQAMTDKTHVNPGERVLIHAGAGGVGGFAIQWAKLLGGHVIVTVSNDEKARYVKELRADEVINYNQDSFVDVLRNNPVDVVFDTVGGSTYTESFKVLKPKGRIVSILEQPNEELAARHNVNASYLFVEPSHEDLRTFGELYDTDMLAPPKITVFPLDKAAEALEAIKEGHTIGKIVLEI